MHLYIDCIIILLVGTAVSLGLPTDEASTRLMYEKFKRDYKKVISNESTLKPLFRFQQHLQRTDDEMRYAIFRQNLKRIDQLQENEQGTARYGVTQFADMTAGEFVVFHTSGYSNRTHIETTPISINDLSKPPENIDWRLKGAVGPVKNQAQCAGCWAFATIGNIEGQWFRKTGQLLSLSEQQLLDCDKGNLGCRKGYPSMAYHQIQQMGGLMLSSDYPFIGKTGECKMDKTKFVAHIDSSVRLDRDEKIQAAYSAVNGPVSMGINVQTLPFYIDGVMHPTEQECSKDFVNHLVLGVGYGQEKRNPYWIIKNSWGEKWGEKGYFRIYRGDNTCSIDRLTTSVTIK